MTKSLFLSKYHQQNRVLWSNVKTFAKKVCSNCVAKNGIYNYFQKQVQKQNLVGPKNEVFENGTGAS